MAEFSNGESLPPQERINISQEWDSGHKPVALKALEKVLTRKISLAHPEDSTEAVQKQVLEKREKLRVWLDAIDRETVNNFTVFESKDSQGVRFPYTKIRVRNVASEVQKTPINPETETLPSKTVVLFTPFIPPPGGGPDDIMNIIYDRVLTALPDLTERESHHAKNITVYGLGLPASKWGSISEEWLSGLKENGFSEYGKLYAEFLRTLSDHGNIMFFAGSMGTVLASETAKQLPEHWKNLRLLLNNPVHNPTGKSVELPFLGMIPLSGKGTQVAAGFMAELGVRTFFDKFVGSALSNAKPAREALSIVLQQKGIMPFESDEQNRLKKSVNTQAVKFLIKGTPLDTESFRSYIEQGMLDPATTNRERIKFLRSKKSASERFYKAGQRSLGMGVNYTHWMDPMRWPDKWVRGIESYERAVDAQNKPFK